MSKKSNRKKAGIPKHIEKVAAFHIHEGNDFYRKTKGLEEFFTMYLRKKI